MSTDYFQGICTASLAYLFVLHLRPHDAFNFKAEIKIQLYLKKVDENEFTLSEATSNKTMQCYMYETI